MIDSKTFDDLAVYEGNSRILLLNPDNNRWIRMRKDYYRKINQNPIQKKKLIELCRQEYNLFTSDSEECSIRSIYFAVTRKCNMQCAFCTMNSGPDVGTENDLTLDEINELLLPKLRELEVKKIIITGGEPVIRNDIVAILKGFAESFSKERILLQTNGLLLTENFIRSVSCYVNTIEISIENIFANKSLLARMRKIFACIREQGLELSLSFVHDEESEPYLWDAIELTHEYGGAFTYRIVSLVGRAADSGEYEEEHELGIVKKYYEYLSYLLNHGYLDDHFISGYLDNLQPKKSCGAFGKILSIHPDGTTYMCGNFKHHDYSMGNIRNHTMQEITDNLRKKLNSDEMKRRFCLEHNPVCMECSEKYFCPGPCAAERTTYTPEMEKNDTKCLSKRAMIHFNMFYYDKDKSVKKNMEAMTGFLKKVIDGTIRFL